MSGCAFKSIFISLLMVIAPALTAATLKVKKSSAKVYSEPKKGSTVVVSLSKGDIVESTGRKGMYWKVKTPAGKSGFISVMKVKRQSGGGSKISAVIREAAKESRASGNNETIRSRSAVMGVRGLDASEQVAYAGNMKPDFRLVYRMEDRAVNQKSLDKIANDIDQEISSRLK